MRVPVLIGLACAAAALVLLSIRNWRDPAPAALDSSVVAAGSAPAATPAIAADAPERAAMAGAAASRPGSPLDFASCLAELETLGLRQLELQQSDGNDAAAALNPTIQALVARAFAELTRVEEQALFAATDRSALGTDPRAGMRRRICALFVGLGLARREQEARLGGGRGALDAFVTAILSTLPLDEQLAQELGELLVGKRYLGVQHEAEVMRLVEAAHGRPVLAGLVTRLLRTLWHNLEATGARSSAELAALALWLKDDPNPSARLAALQQLLRLQQGRHRELAVQEALRLRDARLGRDLAHAAAQELPPREALELLIRLAPLDEQALMTPFLILAGRDSSLLQAAYERMLADDVAPGVRAELVTGAGFEGGEGIETARLAFEMDRDPEVRRRAIFVLTARAGLALGERVLDQALDDPEFSRDPRNLGAIAHALGNLGDVDCNVVERIGRRLQMRKELQPADRQHLEGLLARALPGGGAPRGRGK